MNEARSIKEGCRKRFRVAKEGKDKEEMVRSPKGGEEKRLSKY